MALPGTVVNLQELEIGLTPIAASGQANRMRISTGNIFFTFQGTGGFPVNETVTVSIGAPLAQGQFFRAIAVGAPARLRNEGTGFDAYWAVHRMAAFLEGGQVRVRAFLQVGDTDGFLEALAFEVTTLFRV
jgi:hypothetical protein